MNLFGFLSLLILTVHYSSSELHWDFGEWTPIAGKCVTCEKGRIFQLEQESGRSSSIILSEDLRRRKKAFGSDDSFSSPANIFSLKQKDFSDDPERVQLIYLPEGSINDLRTARVAKIKDVGRVLKRPVRATSFSSRSLPVDDLEAIESTISFREISPRRPTALVAERGKEKEAHEQIQLLEAALNAHPNDVREGELPRVFIAPTHLPPPPGYVKIPLLPSQSHVGSKKTLPRTFLTSEHHNHLPPGFVQVPLPDRVSQLSHSIPFVNPDSSPHFLSHMNQLNRQRDQPREIISHNQNVRQQEQDFSRPLQQFNILQPVQDGFNLGQPIQQQRPQQITQQRPQRLQQNLNNEQPIRDDIDVSQIVQNHFNIRQHNNARQPVNQNFNPEPFNQNFNSQQQQNFNPQPHNQNFNQQPINHNFNQNVQPAQDFGREQTGQREQNLNINPTFQQQIIREQQPVNEPVQHTERQPPSQLNVNFNENKHFSQPPLIHSGSLDNTQDARNINQGRVRQRSRQQNLRQQVSSDSSPQSPEPRPKHQPKRPTSGSFFEIGSSVIKPENDFDYFNIPEFTTNDYEQDFPAYDNQEFELTNQESPKQNIPAPENVIQPEITTQLNSNNHLPTSHSENLEIENQRNVPFKISPRPIHIFPTLSPSPVEPKITEPQEIFTENFNLQDTTTAKPINVQLLPQQVGEKEGSEQDIQINQSVRTNTRGRLRQNSFRGRAPNTLSRHRLNLTPQKVEENLDVEIGTPVVAKELIEDHVTVDQHSTTSAPLLRTRGNLNKRRRRPLRKETIVPVHEEPSTTATPVITASSTLFPPFSVAKRLNEKTDSTQNTQENRGGNISGSRGRFGSRIRSRNHEAVENSNAQVVNNAEATPLNTEGEAEPIRIRGQRKRRLRGRDGNPISQGGQGGQEGQGGQGGQRRRRVLSRVRKISSGSSDNLNNQILNEEHLTGAESARVSYSQLPLNKIPDPIAKTLELINDEKPDHSQPISENNDMIDAQTTSSSGLAEISLSPDNNFNLLNFIPTTEDNLQDTATDNIKIIDSSSPVEIEIIHLGEDDEGYVNNNASFSEHELSFDNHNPSVVSVDAQDLQDGNIPDGQIISENQPQTPSSPFDRLISSISHVPSDEPLSNPISLDFDDTHAEAGTENFFIDQISRREHSNPQSTLINEENLSFANDNTDTLLPENETIPQDNYYYDYDIEKTDPNNGTYVGSSAHVVYAVALSEAPPGENDFTTQQAILEESKPKEEEYQTPALTNAEDVADELITTSAADHINPDIISPTFVPSIDVITDNPSILIEDSDSFITSSSVSHSDSDAVSNIDSIYTTENNFLTSTPSNDLNFISRNAKEVSQLNNQNSFLLDETALSEQEKIGKVTTTSSLQISSEPNNDKISSSDLTENKVNIEIDPSIPEQITNTEIAPIEEYDYEYHGEGIETSPTSVTETINSSEDKILTVNETPVETSQNASNNLTESFLDNFFSPNRESKENTITIDDQTHKILGKSTVTEVRSSAPVICIEGKCFIGSGIKRR